MKHVKFFAIALGATLLAACSSAPAPAHESSPTEPAPAASTPPAAPATTSQACAPKCNVDADCASSCPAVPDAVQCCDTATHACFASKTAACPAPASGSGTLFGY